ncbi:hypothetical protein TNCV_1485701 [Trichonephila clavipes]|nr:hypothetical protein TNCV_1485701 [Trichonephila clavipes]
MKFHDYCTCVNSGTVNAGCVDDAGVAVQRHPQHAQLETDLAFPWPVITGTKAESGFIRKHNRSSFRYPEHCFDTTAIANGNGVKSVEYTLQGTWFGAILEVTVRGVTVLRTSARISATYAVRCATAVCRLRRSFLSVVHMGTRNPILFRQYHPLSTASNNHAQWIHSNQVFLQYRGKKTHLFVTLLHDLGEPLIMAFSSS